ncbi:MAG: helix-turn-helix transcriptional regulator [Alphaproteobacteria bacterium]
MQGNTAEAANEDSGIAFRIREAREARNWTIEQFAQRIGVTPDTVADWESGDRDPRSNRIIMLAGVLGVSAHWLLDGSDAFAPTDDADPKVTMQAQVDAMRVKLAEVQQMLDDLERQI